MKIIAVIGSPRKGNTYHIVSLIEQEMQKLGSVEFEYVFLRESSLEHCRGCLVCFGKGEEHCPIKDSREGIEQRLAQADGLILASPVYALSVTSLMKNFLDRFAYIIHRPRFFGKYALVVSVTGAAFLKDTMKLMADNARYWGFDVVDRVGFVYNGGPVSDEMTARVQKAALRFYGAISEQRPYNPSLTHYIVFHLQRAFFSEPMDGFTRDHEYYLEKGWLEPKSRFYTDRIKFSPVKSTLARIIAKAARKD